MAKTISRSTLLGISLKNQVIARTERSRRSQSQELQFLILLGLNCKKLARSPDGAIEGVVIEDENTSAGRICWYPDEALYKRFKAFASSNPELEGLSESQIARVVVVTALYSEGLL